MSNIANQDGVVYLLTCKVSGKQYVGQSWNYEKRMAEYRLGCSHGEISIAINKYGWNNFTAVRIAQGIQTQDALDKTETAFIALLDTIAPNGYNLMAGGRGGKHNAVTKAKISAKAKGRKHTADARAKMSASRQGEKNHFYGKSHSHETRKKIGDANRGEKSPLFGKPAWNRGKPAWNRGKKASPEARAKMSAAKRGENHPLFGKPAWNRGVPHSEETRRKIRMSCTKFYRDNIIDVIAMRQQGMTLQAIADAVGTNSTGTIHRWLERAGFTR